MPVTGEQVGQQGRALSEGFADRVNAVQRWSLAFETEFLRVGQDLIEMAERLRSARDANLAIAQAVLGPPAEAASAALIQAADALERLSRREEACRAGLSQLHSGAWPPLRCMGTVADAFARLRQLIVVAQVEVARLQGPGQAELDVFVRALVSQVSQGRATVDAMLTKLQGLGSRLGEAVRLDATLGTRRGRSLPAVREQLLAACESFGKHREKTRQIAVDDARLFETVWRAVSDIVARIQFQDQARQRWGHIRAAAIQVESLLEDGTMEGFNEALSPHQQRHAVLKLARVAQSDIRELEADLSLEASDLRDHLLSLSQKAAQAELDASLAFGVEVGARSSVLETLDRDVCTALQARSSDLACWQAVRAAIIAPAEMAAQLASMIETVREVEMDMRLAGLNATLRASRLQSGSRSMQEIAREIRSQAAAINTGTTGSVAAVQTLAQNAVCLRDDVLAAIDQDERTAQRCLEAGGRALQVIEETVRQHHLNVSEASAGVARRLGEAAQDIVADRTGCPALSALAEKLQEIAVAFEKPGPAPDWPELDRLVEERYSSHRHKRVLTSTTRVAAPVQAEEQDLSDVLF
jgi:hypothetical protein